MTDPITFAPYNGWVDVTDPNNLPPDARVIGAADLLRYENLGRDIALWTQQWIDTDPGEATSVDGNAATILIRGWPAAQWATVNPVLANREMGVETNTGKIKFGDGVTLWANLPYAYGAILDGLQNSKADTDHTHPAEDISDAGAAGRALLTAPSDSEAREAIGAAAAVGPDDIEITSGAKGLILKSPDGTRFRITVDDDGALMTTSL
jgi:hypothetical protein